MIQELTEIQLDRAAGAVVGSALGDALGAPYEFGPPHSDDFIPELGPGMGGEEPGAWTDDTAMAIPILEAYAANCDGDDGDNTQRIIDGWYRWIAEDGRGIGQQTFRVLSQARRDPTVSGLLTYSELHHNRQRFSGGNGALMRIAPLPLGSLRDYDGEGAQLWNRRASDLVRETRTIAQLTHWEDDNGDACVL